MTGAQAAGQLVMNWMMQPELALVTAGRDLSQTADKYESVATVAHRKRFGQVFTPPRVAALMVDWIAGASPACILDPAVGLGALAAACLEQLPAARVSAIDADSLILSYMPTNLSRAVSIRCGDFLAMPMEERFDAVIMNPPYIRHRELSSHEERRAGIARASGCAIPRSANLYVDFVLKALLALRPRGRAAILIPAEWMSANFSASLKRMLIDSGSLRGVVTFSHASRIFTDALTTASLLLIEKGDGGEAVASHYLTDVHADEVPPSMVALEEVAPARAVARSALRDAAKWDPLLRGHDLALPDGWTSLGTLASPRRGIATGANGFFLLDRDSTRREGLRQRNLAPCVGRARDVAGLVFTPKDFAHLDGSGGKVWLLDFAVPPDARERAYVERGEAAGLTERTLLRMRRPWFSMEQRKASPIWAAVFGRGDLRFVHNAAGVKSLTNFHCLYPHDADATYVRALVAVLNSTRVRDLLVNHRRGFGGGLAKVEPNDLLTIPVPDLGRVEARVLAQLAAALDQADRCLRDREEEALACIDEIVEAIA